jgi:uncharacterized protein (DUF305 family)
MEMKSMSTNRLLLMAALHLVIMYGLMYAMVNTFSNVVPNLNNLYMAGLMTSPMLILEAILMGSMYENKRAIRIIMVASAVALIVFFLFIRQQTFIGDRELVRSMIPHHAGAILMCEQASLDDSETVGLCRTIIESQEAEIAQMRAILDRLD